MTVVLVSFPTETFAGLNLFKKNIYARKLDSAIANMPADCEPLIDTALVSSAKSLMANPIVSPAIKPAEVRPSTSNADLKKEIFVLRTRLIEYLATAAFRANEATRTIMMKMISNIKNYLRRSCV